MALATSCCGWASEGLAWTCGPRNASGPAMTSGIALPHAVGRRSAVAETARRIRAGRGARRAERSRAAICRAVRRNAACYDVAVLGATTEAYAAALELARKGQQVLVIDHAFSGMPLPRSGTGTYAVHVPQLDPFMAHLLNESTAWWGEWDSRAVAEVGSVDIGPGGLPSAPILPRAWGSDGGALEGQPDRAMVEELGGVEGLKDVCEQVGVKVEVVDRNGAARLHPSLRLEVFDHALYHKGGLVVDAVRAREALRARAIRGGVHITPGLELRGWTDRGDRFVLRLGREGETRVEEEAMEVEQLVLAVGPWTRAVLETFGVSASGILAEPVPCKRLSMRGAGANHPLVMFHDPLGLRFHEERLRAAKGRPGSLEAVPPPLDLEGAMYGWYLLPPRAGSKAKLSAVVDRRAWLLRKAAGPRGQRMSLEMGDRLPPADAWLTRARYEASMLHVAALARGVLPALEPFPGGTGMARAPPRATLYNLSLDGRPLLGAHPFLEEGRFVVCCPCQAPQAPPDTSLALAPLLGQMVAHLCRGGVLPLSMQQTLSLERVGLGVSAGGSVQYDPWSEFPEQVARACGALGALAAFDDAGLVEGSEDEEEGDGSEREGGAGDRAPRGQWGRTGRGPEGSRRARWSGEREDGSLSLAGRGRATGGAWLGM